MPLCCGVVGDGAGHSLLAALVLVANETGAGELERYVSLVDLISAKPCRLLAASTAGGANASRLGGGQATRAPGLHSPWKRGD